MTIFIKKARFYSGLYSHVGPANQGSQTNVNKIIAVTDQCTLAFSTVDGNACMCARALHGLWPPIHWKPVGLGMFSLLLSETVIN